MLRVAINGFGRIGRLLLRAHLTRPHDRFNIIAINDIMPIETAAHLLQYDSVHGVRDDISYDAHHIIIGRKKIAYISVASPDELPWEKLGVQVVAECSGRFNKKELAYQHVTKGAQRVLLSAPCSDADKMVVFGINHTSISSSDIVISNASCTTNALAPIIAALHQEMGIQSAYLSTVHAYTADQRLIDAHHKDLRRARAAAESIIPTSTGSARAIGVIFPELKGRIDGIAVRVPTADVSFVDLSINIEQTTSVQDINDVLLAFSKKNPTIMGVCPKPLVSKDFINTAESVVIDSLLTQVVHDHLVKIFGWYDNEWGFSHRMCDMLSYLQSL